MKTSGKCPKCGGTDIVAGAKALDRADYGAELDLTIATFGRPDALIFKEQEVTSVSAWVCVTCGFVEFYAVDPRRIKLPRA